MKKLNCVSACNNGYSFFAETQLRNFNSVFDKENALLHILCFDEKVCNKLESIKKELNINNVLLYLDNTSHENSELFNTAAFIDMSAKKFKFSYEVLEKYGNVYHFDSDVFFMKDPTEHVLNKLETYDVIFQQDAPITDNHKLGETYVCTGHFAAKRNDASLNLLYKVIIMLNRVNNDQEILYKYLYNNCKDNNVENYKNAKLGVFDPELFQNGFDAFRSNWYLKEEKVCVHLNHMVGLDEKMMAFNKLGL